MTSGDTGALTMPTPLPVVKSVLTVAPSGLPSRPRTLALLTDTVTWVGGCGDGGEPGRLYAGVTM